MTVSGTAGGYLDIKASQGTAQATATNSGLIQADGGQVLLTTLAGQLIAEAMQGTAERFDLFAKLPVRPFPGGPLLRHPLYVAGMLYYALRDRL